MVKDEKKGKKTASAARASQMLAQQGNGASSAAPIGFGFGGYVGSQNLSTALGVSNSQDGGLVTPVLDPELQLHVKRLSKKDPTTTTRALQSLRELANAQPDSQLQLLLPVWATIYPRLATDNARSVREAAAKLQSVLCQKAGKGLAPFLKQLMGPWLLQQHDLHTEVSKSAASGLTAVFPTLKLTNAITFCSSQVADYLVGLVSSSPEVLGDPQRESVEELQERYERTVASALATLATLITLSSEDDPEDLISSKIQAFVSQQAFGKKYLASKSVLIRRQSYHLVAALADRRPNILEPSSQGLAPRVLAALSDKDASNHREMWAMLLGFCKAFPSALEAVDLRKALLPNLTAFLKSACCGSGSVSYPAIYPFLTCIPLPGLLAAKTAMQDITGSILVGVQTLPPPQSRLVDAESCFLECVSFFSTQCSKAVQLLGTKDEQIPGQSLQQEFLSHVVREQLIPLVFSNHTGSGGLGCRLLRRVLTNITTTGEPGLLSKLLQGICQELLQRSNDSLKLKCSQGDAEIASDAKHTLACIKELLHSLADCMDHAVLREELQTQVGRPLLEAWGAEAKQLPEGVEMITQLMNSMEVSVSNLEGVKAASLNALSEGPGSDSESQEQSQSAWIQYIAASILHSPTPSDMLVDTVQCILGLDKGNEDLRAELVGGVFDSLGTQAARMGAKNVLLSCDHPHSTNKIDDFFASLIAGLEAGNTSQALVLGSWLNCKTSAALISSETRLLAASSLSKVLRQHVSETLLETASPSLHESLSAGASSLHAALSSLQKCIVPTCTEDAHSSDKEDDLQQIAPELLVGILQISVLDSQAGEMANEIWDQGKILSIIAERLGKNNTDLLATRIADALKALVLLYFSGKVPVSHQRLARRLADYQCWIHRTESEDTCVFDIVLTALSSRGSPSSSSASSELVYLAASENDNLQEAEKTNNQACQLLAEVFVNAGFDAMFLLERHRAGQATSQDDMERLSELAQCLLSVTYLDSKEHPDLIPLFHHKILEHAHLLLLTMRRLRRTSSSARINDNKIKVLDQLAYALTLRDSYADHVPASPLVLDWVEDQDSTFEDSRMFGPFSRLLDIFRNEKYDREVDPTAWQAMSRRNVRQISAARKLVPLWRVFETGPAQLETVLAYLPTQRGTLKPKSFTEEQQALVDLCENAMASYDGMKRQQVMGGPSGASSSGHSIFDRSGATRAADIHARLLLAGFAYASELVSQDFKRRAVIQLRELLSPTVIAFEEAAESLGSAVLKVMAGLNTDALGTMEAFETLKRLKAQMQGLPAKEFQEKLTGMETEFLNREQLMDSAAAAQNIIEASLSLLTHSSADENQQLAGSLLLDLLRSVLAIGAILSIGQLCVKRESLLMDWIDGIGIFLEPLSECCAVLASSSGPLLIQAAVAMDDWSADTGVDSLGACFGILGARSLVLPEYSEDLWKLAIQLLTMPELSSRLARNIEEEDEEELAQLQAQAEESRRISQILMAYGLRPDLALHMEKLAYLPVEHDSSEEEEEEQRLMGQDNVLFWTVLLIHILELPTESSLRHSICQALHTAPGLVDSFLDFLVRCLPLADAKEKRTPSKPQARPEPGEAAKLAAQARAEGGQSGPSSPAQELRNVLASTTDLSVITLAVPLYGAMLRALPVSVRSWFQGLTDKRQSSALEAYTVAKESNRIILDELAGVSGNVTQQDESDEGVIELSAKAKIGRREAVALVTLEGESILELVIQLPECWPLEGAKLECRKGVGVAEARRRKWMLNITAMLRSQNVTLSDAISMWQKNCARQFAGVEECLICYNVILAGTGQLPKLCCKTCGKKFHNGCLYKWFRTSHKSACPHCQSPW